MITSVNKGINPSFTSIRYRYATYTDMYGIPRGTQNTTIVRDDLDCRELAKIIRSNFKNKDKVNIMPMNASDLTETYSVTTALIDEFGFEQVQKRFTPILATDVDDFVVEKFGKKGIVAFSDMDIYKIGHGNVHKYFERAPKGIFPLPNEVMLPNNHKKFQTREFFRKLFKVEKMDLQQRIADMSDNGNSVVLIRNCLAQSFGSLHSSFIYYQLEEKLKKGSLLVIGDYDRHNMKSMVDELNGLDFHEIGKNIFRKGLPPINQALGSRLSLAFQKIKNVLK